MKASELITILIRLISEEGDCPVYMTDRTTEPTINWSATPRVSFHNSPMGKEIRIDPEKKSQG